MPAADSLSSNDELVAKARLGDEAAAALLIAGVAPFVRRTAKKYALRIPGTDRDDLYQAGLIAVGQAFDGYDASRPGARWESYAMTAAARGIAREAARAKTLASRFPTPDPGTDVDCETLPEPEPAWDPSEDGAVWSMRVAIEELDPLEKAIIQMANGMEHEKPLEWHEIGARLGIRGRRAAEIEKGARDRLKRILELRGFGEGVHGKA